MDSETYYDFGHPSILNEITKSCEKLVKETQCDLEIFRNEQQELLQKIFEIQEENNRFNSKLEALQSATLTNGSIGETIDDATREKLTKEAFQNVKTQLEYLQTENLDLRSLKKFFQKNIENLEKENQNYRNQLFKPASTCELKQKYETTIKILESTIVSQKSHLKEQQQIIETLWEQKKKFKSRIENLEKTIEQKNIELSKCPEMSDNILKLEEQLKESLQHNKELQNSLQVTKLSVEGRYKREQQSLKKVQEALTIAEAAVAEKEEALRRERVLKEEYANIATTIGQVMDEAARKVEKDMEAMRKTFCDKEKTITEEKYKMNEEILNQNKLNQILNTRCKRFEENYKEAIKENEKLVKQLHLAAKSIHEMQQMLTKQETLPKNSEHIEKQPEDQYMEIMHYAERNKQINDKYRMALNDLTNSFEQQIYILKSEVANLKVENKRLKQRYPCRDND